MAIVKVVADTDVEVMEVAEKVMEVAEEVMEAAVEAMVVDTLV